MSAQGDDLEVCSTRGGKTALASKKWQRSALISASSVEKLY